MSNTEEQSQKQWKSNKRVTTLALLATIAAAISAMFSTITAFKAQSYIEEINQSKISLQDKKKVTAKIQDGKVNIEVEYSFKIVGQEPVEILNMKIGTFNFKTDEFSVFQDHYSLVNKQFPENIFRHAVTIKVPVPVPILESSLPNEEIAKKIIPRMGKQVIIFNIQYRSGKQEKTEVKFYSIFREGSLRSLSNKEYKQIERFLPEEFRL